MVADLLPANYERTRVTVMKVALVFKFAGFQAASLAGPWLLFSQSIPAKFAIA